MSKKKKRKKSGAAGAWALMALAVAVVLLLAVLDSGTADSAVEAFSTEITAENPVRMNEIMTANTSAVMLSDGSLPDWIELTNAGDEDVSLAGYALMRGDDPTQIYLLPDATIPAGGWLVVYCDGGSDRAGEMHAPFKLAASGETLVLMDASGAVIDSVTTPALADDQVYCRDAMDV